MRGKRGLSVLGYRQHATEANDNDSVCLLMYLGSWAGAVCTVGFEHAAEKDPEASRKRRRGRY